MCLRVLVANLPIQRHLINRPNRNRNCPHKNRIPFNFTHLLDVDNIRFMHPRKQVFGQLIFQMFHRHCGENVLFCRMNFSKITIRLHNLSGTLEKAEKHNDFIFVKDGTTNYKIDFADLLYVQAYEF